MNICQVVVALLRCLERFHLVGWALEAHADRAASALDLETSCVADH